MKRAAGNVIAAGIVSVSLFVNSFSALQVQVHPVKWAVLSFVNSHDLPPASGLYALKQDRCSGVRYARFKSTFKGA